MRVAEAKQMSTSQQQGTEVSVFDRPGISVVRTTRSGASCYLLRVRSGASKSLVSAATRTLADAGCELAQRTLGDVTEYEFEVLSPAWSAAA
jgi:hypothetical protein